MASIKSALALLASVDEIIRKNLVGEGVMSAQHYLREAVRILEAKSAIEQRRLEQRKKPKK